MGIKTAALKTPAPETPGHQIPGHQIPGHQIPGHQIPGHETPEPKTTAELTTSTTRWTRAGLLTDQGTTTAEYAMVTMAAVAFGGLLMKVVGGSEVAGLLTGLVRRALSV